MVNVLLSKKAEKQKGVIVCYEREDGLQVFLDDDDELNAIRLTADKLTVIKAVAIRRAQQIACNYARKYAPELLTNLNSEIEEDNKKYLT